VNVTSSTQGSYINTIPAGAIQTLQGVTNAGLASATLNVQQLNLTKGFAKSPIAAGSTTLATSPCRIQPAWTTPTLIWQTLYQPG